MIKVLITKKGIHLDAQKFNDLLNDDDTICIDTEPLRATGHFRGAITPDVDTLGFLASIKKYVRI